MKRDMNLVRELLFLAEADGDDAELCKTPQTPLVVRQESLAELIS